MDQPAAPLPGGAWEIWRNVIVRGTGFPIALVADLVDEGEASAADRYSAAVAELHAIKNSIVDRLRVAAAAQPAERHRLWALIRLVWRCESRGLKGYDGPELSALQHALESRDLAYRALVCAGESEDVRVEQQAATLLNDPFFREAMLWQAPNSLAPLQRRLSLPAGHGNDKRYATRCVAMRAQRYAVKNDSIGFFGPVWWGALADDEMFIELRAPAALIAERHVYFEGWCIDALLERLNAEPVVKQWVAPRLRTGVWRGNDGVYAPGRGRVALEDEDAEILALCDGRRTASEIAERLTSLRGLARNAVFDRLNNLSSHGIATWRLEVASQLHPERDVARWIQRVTDPEVNAWCSGLLDTLCSARDAVAAAAGRPETLAVRLRELNTTFTQLTGISPVRRAGAAYSARSLVYEDCRRTGELRLGRAFVDRIGPSLTVALDASRWVAVKIATAARAELLRQWRDLKQSVSDVDAARFRRHVEAGGRQPLLDLCRKVTEEYQRAWATVLERNGRAPLADVIARARELFDPRGQTWTRAEYFSPDLMVAAADLEAFRRGNFDCILGELHGINTLIHSALASQHPEPEALVAALERDTRGTTVVVMQTPKEEWLARTSPLLLPNFWRYEYHEDLPEQGCRSLPAAMLMACDEGDGLVMRARDGSVEFDALELFGNELCRELHRIIPQRLPFAPHTPRVTIGTLTIARESWHVTAESMPFLDQRNRYLQFAAVRQWARSLGMPRRVFFKSPDEPKPCYLDFSSHTFVDIFIARMKQVRVGGRVSIAEMLPRYEDAWLTDGAGRRYTSELRVAVRLPVRV